MTAEHPAPRALAEARDLGDLREALAKERALSGPVYEGTRRARERTNIILNALAASQPPAVQGWVDITHKDVERELGFDAGMTAKVLAAVNAAGKRRFAERASEGERA